MFHIITRCYVYYITKLSLLWISLQKQQFALHLQANCCLIMIVLLTSVFVLTEPYLENPADADFEGFQKMLQAHFLPGSRHDQ